jgi:hypothetical protein
VKSLLEIFLLAAAITAFAPARADFIDDSLALDRVYIPALAFTNEGDAAKSAAAMSALMAGWKRYHGAHRSDYPQDPDWAKAFDRTGKFIMAAARIMKDPRGSLVEAHDALEQVRVSLRHLRRSEQIDYFPDHLTAFHEPMENIVLAAKGKSPSDLSDEDLDEIRSSLPDLLSTWESLRNAPFDPARLKLDERQANMARQLMQQETETIDAFRVAMDAGDRATMLRQAMALKPPFVQLYTMFGDFGRFAVASGNNHHSAAQW